MTLRKIVEIRGKAMPIPENDIDTDRIIPAAYMKCVTFDGLGQYLFRDARFRKDGTPTEHPLNDTRYQGAQIMIARKNFGCGSSREHAPQAIYRAGFEAIIAENFAEIFFGNATGLGIVCVNMQEKDITDLTNLIEQNPETEVTVDLKKKRVCAGGNNFSLEIRESARESLINGKWDAISDLLEGIPQVKEWAEKMA
ncbi:MAG: 3-isopropylmalate dehydratase small subunit [Verrucomicrobiota bacterium]